MSVVCNLTITNEVTNYFEKIINDSNKINETKIIVAVEKTLLMLKKSSLQAYVTSRISTLENMLQMLSDKQWAMTDIDKQYVLSALQYFAQQDDVIPDNLPVVGLLDDCIVIDIVAEKIKPELEAYIEFVTMAQIYAKDSEYSVNDWLETKRKELFSRMRHRRSRRYKSRRSRGTSFSIV